jgi:hypothetical protein
MNEINKEDATMVTIGLVLRTPLESLPELKKYIVDLPLTKIVYQRLSAGHLIIAEEKQDEMSEMRS